MQDNKPLKAFGVVFILGCFLLGGYNLYLQKAKPGPKPDDPVVVNVETEIRKARDKYLNSVADVMHKYGTQDPEKTTVREQGEVVFAETGPLLDQWRKDQNEIIASQVGKGDLDKAKFKELMLNMEKGTRP